MLSFNVDEVFAANVYPKKLEWLNSLLPLLTTCTVSSANALNPQTTLPSEVTIKAINT